MQPTLILDTSVLIAGLKSSLGASYALLGLVGTSRFTLGLSAALVLEYEATCLKLLPELNFTTGDIQELLDYFCHVGTGAPIRFRVRPSVSDPNDELVLEAAVACRCEWIVTHNIRDMASGAARYGIDVITPGEALRRLGV